MKPLRLVYLAVLMSSLTLALVSYYRYQLKDKELVQYQDLSHYSNKVLIEVSARLAQTKRDLEKSWKQTKKLNLIIVALEKDNLSSKGELQALKEEREKLQNKIARLVEEKAVWEKNLFSLEELKKAIRIAKIEKYRRSKIERIQRRLAKIEMLKALDEIALQQGNRGYLARAGKATFRPTRIRVELEPASKLSYKEIE